MIDVQPPHAPAHTWKDFFIHIATICVGLLIAIGLEQSVENIHRTHERKLLIAALHEECVANSDALDKRAQSERASLAMLRSDIESLRDAKTQGGTITVQLPPREKRTPGAHTPSRSVWTAAKASGKVDLLPDNLIEVYDRVDFEGSQFESYLKPQNDASLRIVYFGIRLGQRIAPGATLHLTLAQRDEFEGLFSDVAATVMAQQGWGVEWNGATHAVLDGVTTREDVLRYIDRAVAAERDE